MNNVRLKEDLDKQWTQYSDDSEVWVFQASRPIIVDQALKIVEESRKFAAQWSSHGTALQATASIFYDRFLVFIVNGSEGPSGCSKDSLTHFVQSIGMEYNLDFFNRMQVSYKSDKGLIVDTHLHEIKELYVKQSINDNTIVFNNLVKSKSELLNSWEIPLKESWHKQFI